MVYPGIYNSSAGGSREIIDVRDESEPIVVLARHRGSDHHFSFPTSCQIRSMFNTSKINACSCDISSPSTMSDPVEWRSARQLDFLEERLMRIHHWEDSTYYSRPYEGQTISVVNLNQLNANDMSSNIDSAVFGFETPSRDILYGVDDVTTVNMFDNFYENQSEKSDQSDQTKDDQDDHREYDVEEYVECTALTDGSDNSSRVFNEEFVSSHVEKMQPTEATMKPVQDVVLDSESFERQKQLEHFFNLSVKEHDNEFTGELKTVMVDEMKKYLVQKDGKCTFEDDIKKVAEILNRAINDKDSVLCDKVHQLCLRIRDILVLKDEILSNAPTESANNALTYPQTDTDHVSINTPDNSASDIPNLGQSSHDLENEKITMVHTFNKEPDLSLQSSVQAKRESFESLIKFSRIPVFKNKFIRNSELNHTENKSTIKSNTCSRVPTTKAIVNRKGKCTVASNRRDDRSHLGKQKTTSYSKDILQQKEEIMRKAQVLGLLDGVNKLGKVPHLTERAQLTLLDKQIQGKMKNRQLALDRKKIGLRDRVSSLKLNNSDSSQRFSNVKLNSECSESNLRQRKTHNDNTAVSALCPAITESDEFLRPHTQTKTTRVNTQQIDAVPQEITVDGVLNRIELNEICDSPKNSNIRVHPKLTISPVDTWSTNTIDLSPHYSKNSTQEKKEVIVRSVACNTHETDLSRCFSQQLAAENLSSKIPITTSMLTEQRQLVLDSRKAIMMISLLVVAVAFIFYFFQSEIFDVVNQCRYIFDGVRQNVAKSQLSNTFTNHFKDFKGYVKRKCELL